MAKALFSLYQHDGNNNKSYFVICFNAEVEECDNWTLSGCKRSDSYRSPDSATNALVDPLMKLDAIPVDLHEKLEQLKTRAAADGNCWSFRWYRELPPEVVDYFEPVPEVA